MNKLFVSMSLINGNVILCEVESKLDATGYYVVHNPMKPIVVNTDGTSNIVLTQMNPFSDSAVFKIHPSKVITMGSMIADYIDIYNEAVDNANAAIDKRYRKLLAPVTKSHNFDDYVTDETVKTLQ